MHLQRGKRKVVVPVANPTNTDIVLRARTNVGVVNSVSSVIPCPVEVNSVSCEGVKDQKRDSETDSSADSDSVESEDGDSECHDDGSDISVDSESEEEMEATVGDESWMQKIDVSHPSVSQQKQVKRMLRRNADVFSKDSGDIGSIDNLQMKINLKDADPVKASYTSIPKPLYKEVKEYVEDLLASGWVRKSYSNYSSPMVCVRKKGWNSQALY